jgi:hypothetical protein
VGDPLENGEKAPADRSSGRAIRSCVAYCLGSRLNAELWFGHDRSRAPTMQKRRQMWRYVCSPISAMRTWPLAFSTITVPAIKTGPDRDWNRNRRLRRRQKFGMALVPSGDAKGGGTGNANFKRRYLDPKFVCHLEFSGNAYRDAPICGSATAVDNALLVNPIAHLFSIARASIDLKKHGDTAHCTRHWVRFRATIQAAQWRRSGSGSV